MSHVPMIQALLNAGQHLAEALRAENEALARLDLSRAATLATTKLQASDAFAAAYGAATKTGSTAQGDLRDAAERLAGRLRDLSEENRRLLERAIALQSRVIETIAGAAIPASRPTTYGGMGQRAIPRQAPSLALAARA
jgi:ABC-type transporter Mla subunit MlaD